MIKFQNVTVRGDVILDSLRLPTVMFEGCDIIGSLSFKHAKLSGSLTVRSCNIDHDLDLSHAGIQGIVTMGAAKIDGSLLLVSSQITGGLFCRSEDSNYNPTTVGKDIVLSGVDIPSHAEFNCIEVGGQFTVISPHQLGSLYLRVGLVATPPGNPQTLEFKHAHVRQGVVLLGLRTTGSIDLTGLRTGDLSSGETSVAVSPSSTGGIEICHSDIRGNFTLFNSDLVLQLIRDHKDWCNQFSKPLSKLSPLTPARISHIDVVNCRVQGELNLSHTEVQNTINPEGIIDIRGAKVGRLTCTRRIPSNLAQFLPSPVMTSCMHLDFSHLKCETDADLTGLRNHNDSTIADGSSAHFEGDLNLAGARLKQLKMCPVRIEGSLKLGPSMDDPNYGVPSEYSSVDDGLLLRGALIKGELVLNGLNSQPSQADKKIIDLSDAEVWRNISAHVSPQGHRARCHSLSMRSLKCLGDVELYGLDIGPTASTSASDNGFMNATISGGLSLSSAKIDTLWIGRASFSEKNPSVRSSDRPAMDMSAAEITGSVLFCNKTAPQSQQPSPAKSATNSLFTGRVGLAEKLSRIFVVGLCAAGFALLMSFLASEYSVTEYDPSWPLYSKLFVSLIVVIVAALVFFLMARSATRVKGLSDKSLDDDRLPMVPVMCRKRLETLGCTALCLSGLTYTIALAAMAAFATNLRSMLPAAHLIAVFGFMALLSRWYLRVWMACGAALDQSERKGQPQCKHDASESQRPDWVISYIHTFVPIMWVIALVWAGWSLLLGATEISEERLRLYASLAILMWLFLYLHAAIKAVNNLPSANPTLAHVSQQLFEIAAAQNPSAHSNNNAEDQMSLLREMRVTRLVFDSLARVTGVIPCSRDTSFPHNMHLSNDGIDAAVKLDRATIGHLQIVRPIPRLMDLSNLRVDRWGIGEKEPAREYLELLEHASEYKSANYVQIEQSLRNQGKRGSAERVHRAMCWQELWRDRRLLQTVWMLLHSLIGFGTKRAPLVLFMVIWFLFTFFWIATEYPNVVELTPHATGQVLEIKGNLRSDDSQNNSTDSSRSALLGELNKFKESLRGPAENPIIFKERLGVSFAMALRYHVPIINLDLWPYVEPKDPPMWVYTTIVAMIHWILWPLLLASLIPAILPKKDQ